MTYEAWRISYQSSEQAARAAYAECVRLRDRLEAAETAWKVSDKSCYGLTEKVIPNLRDQLESAEKERDALRAKVEAMEKQEPVAWLHESRRDSDVVTSAVKHVWGKAVVGSLAAYSIPLYLAPGVKGE